MSSSSTLYLLWTLVSFCSILYFCSLLMAFLRSTLIRLSMNPALINRMASCLSLSISQVRWSCSSDLTIHSSSFFCRILSSSFSISRLSFHTSARVSLLLSHSFIETFSRYSSLASIISFLVFRRISMRVISSSKLAHHLNHLRSLMTYS